MTFFHIPTAFLLVGLLYFVMPVVTWVVLSSRRSAAVALWCGGDIFFGLGVILLGLRGHVPEWATFPLANLLMFSAVILHIQSLRLDLAVPWRTRWMALAALLYVLGVEGIRRGLGDALLRLQYTQSTWVVMYLYIAVLAWRIGHLERSRSARWIAGVCLLLAVAFVYSLIRLSIGLSPPDPLNSNPSNIFLALAGILAEVIGNIAYVGLAFERSQRRTAEMENELKNSEARYRSYFELPLTGRAVTSPTKGWLDVNATLCDMLGYSKTELAQMTWAELTDPEDMTADLVQFNRVMAGEIDGYTLEKRFMHKDGHSVHTHLAVNCIRMPDQAVDYVIALILDITERKQAEAALRVSEQALRESNARYDELVRRIPVGVYTLRLNADGEASFVYASEKFCQIFGLTEPEIFHDAESVLGFIHPDDRASLDESNRIAAQTLEPFRWEGRIQLMGETRWLRIESDSTPLPNGDSLWNGVIIDITQRKLTEAALRESEILLREAIEFFPIPLSIADNDGNILIVNRQFTEVFGYSLDDIPYSGPHFSDNHLRW